jgi:GNAT superfamily N-acetyltransferase
MRDFCLRRGGVADYDGIRRLREAVYGVPRSLESIRWLYEANPAGPCQLWLAEDIKTKQIVACRPVFPWRMRIGDRVFLVGQAGDAMTHPGFRRRGIFSALVKLAWLELRDQKIPFGFSFSEAASLSVYKKTTVGDGPRAGTHEVLRFQRLMYPLSLRLIREWMPTPRSLIGGLDLANRAFQRWRLTLPGGLSVSRVHRFGEEFDDLWIRTATQYGVLTVRDSRYLNWRFMDLPTGAFLVFALRSHGELVGYVAFEIEAAGNGWIADLFGVRDPEIITALLKASLSTMLAMGCVRASIWVATDNPFFTTIRDFGFVPRADRVPMAVHVYIDGAEAQAALDAPRWWAWFGDRDVEREAEHPVGTAQVDT